MSSFWQSKPGDKKPFLELGRVLRCLLVFGGLTPYLAHAECVIKEFPDRYEVVCTGVPLTAAEKEALAAESRAREAEARRVKTESAKVEPSAGVQQKAELLPPIKKPIVHERFARPRDNDRRLPGGKILGNGKEMSRVAGPGDASR